MYITVSILIQYANVIHRYECDRVLHRVSPQEMQEEILMTLEKSSISVKVSLLKTELLNLSFWLHCMRLAYNCSVCKLVVDMSKLTSYLNGSTKVHVYFLTRGTFSLEYLVKGVYINPWFPFQCSNTEIVCCCCCCPLCFPNDIL